MQKKIFRFILTMLVIFFINTFSFAIEPYNIIEYKQGIFVIEINTEKSEYKLMPYIVEELSNNYDIYNELNAKLVVNGGFFDPKNQKTVSYVVINGETVLNPNDNENLMSNIHLKPYLNKILNRSEFRILENENGEIIYDIARHEDTVQDGLKLIHSIQAGPMLYPNLNLEEEFFILVENGELKSESASSLHRYARTGIGIKGKKVYIFIATKNSPLTLQELAKIMRIWGVDKAMAFDGGGSTSLDCNDLHIISDYSNQGRKLKSFLILN